MVDLKDFFCMYFLFGY